MVLVGRCLAIVVSLGWLALPAHADRVAIGSVTIEPPAGFRVDGMRLVADGGIWAFSPPAETDDLDAWFASAWKVVAGNFRDVQAVAPSKQTLPSGFVVAVQGASAGDAAGHDHYLVLYAAYWPATHRVYASLFDATSDAHYRALAPEVGKALATIALAPEGNADKRGDQPAQSQPAPAAESLPDGKYGCQTISYGIAGPATLASALGNIVLAHGSYESLGYKKRGRFRISGDRVTFAGGPFDGWAAQIASSSGGPYFRFSGSNRKEPGAKSQTNDDLCYLMKR